MIVTRPQRLMALILVAALLGCGQGLTDPEVHRVAVGDTASLGLGDSVVFEATSVRADVIRLVADSRCPIGGTCVWEGDAEVALRVGAGGQAVEVGLHTRLEPAFVRIGSYELHLVDVLPYPRVGPTTDPPALEVLLRLMPASAP